jgi:hypothetical protein
MELTRSQAGPYLRALQAGLHALAPNDDFVPVGQALAHLQALDPRLSGTVLLPAEVDDRSGLPAFVWLERALAEQALAQVGDAAADGAADSEDEVERLARLDPELAERMRRRVALHAHLRAHTLLPTSRLEVVPRRRGAVEAYRASYDSLSATGLWVRVRVELEGPTGWAGGLLATRPDGTVRVDEGMLHLLARHAATPLLGMATQLAAGSGARVTRLARSVAGPFWFPGFARPKQVPAALGNGLLLHLYTEVLGVDVRRSMHRDPLHGADPMERAPEGSGIYRERRFAASPTLVGELTDWSRRQGCEVAVVPLVPRG